MIIHRLHFKNFGCFVEQTFEFDPSHTVFMLHGKNGRGKSTVLQGLSLHLINDIADTLKELIRWGSTEFYTEIDFTYDGHQYFQSIRCDGAAERILIIDGDDLHPFKNSDAIKKLASVLEPRMFKAAAFVMQNSVDIVETSPSERRDYLMKVYDLDFKQSVENLEMTQRDIESTLLTLKSDKLGLENTHYDILEITRPLFGPNGLMKRQTEADDIQRFITLSDQAVETYRELVKTVSDLEEQFSQLQETVSKSQASLEEHEEKLIESGRAQAKELGDLEISLKASFNNLSAQKERLKTLTETEPTFTETSTYSTEVEEHRLKLSKIELDIESTQSRIELHKQGRCPTCGSAFQGADLQDLETALERLLSDQLIVTSALSEKKKALLLYETEKRDYDRDLAIYRSNLSQLTNLDSQLSSHRVDANGQRSRMVSSHLASDQQSKSMTQVLQAGLDRSKSSLNEVQSALDRKRTELQDFPAIDEEALKTKRDRLSVLRGEIQVYNDTLAENKRVETANAATILRRSADKVKIEELVKSISTEEIRLAHHLSAIKIFKRDLPSYIVSTLIEGIVDEMNNFLSEAYNKYRVSLEEVKTGIRIVYGPNKADVSRASGYERQVFSSAWRHAREQLTGYGIALLDEADSASDRDNAELFYRTLMSTNLYDNGQLIIISHKDETKQLLEQEFEAGIFEIV